MNEKHLNLEPDALGEDFWVWNLPLQVSVDDNGNGLILNYMARKDRCADLDEEIPAKDLPAICRNTARVLRNLATLFDLKAEGKIDVIYYPNEDPQEAIADAETSRK